MQETGAGLHEVELSSFLWRLQLEFYVLVSASLLRNDAEELKSVP